MDDLSTSQQEISCDLPKRTRNLYDMPNVAMKKCISRIISPEEKIFITTLTHLAHEKLWRKGVADAARFSEQERERAAQKKHQGY